MKLTGFLQSPSTMTATLSSTTSLIGAISLGSVAIVKDDGEGNVTITGVTVIANYEEKLKV